MKNQVSGTGPAWAPFDLLTFALIDFGWVLRRVESLRIEEDGGTLVRVSLDVSIGPSIDDFLNGARGVLPLAWLKKGPITRLNVSAGGAEVSVLTKAQNSALMVRSILARAAEAGYDWSKHQARLLSIVEEPPERASVERDALLDEEGITGQESVPEGLRVNVIALEQLVHGFVLAVEANGVKHGRFTLKYSYDASSSAAIVHDARTGRLRYQLAAFTMAGSSHAEVEVPAPLRLVRSAVVERDDHSEREVAVCEEPSAIHHLVAQPAEPFTEYEWESRVLVAESTVTRLALLAPVATAAVCAYLFVGTWEMWLLGREGLSVDSATSLLVGAAGLLVPVFGRAPRHPVVDRFVRPLRTVTALSGTTVFLTALFIATLPAEPLLAWSQGTLLAASIALAVWALWLRRRVSERRSIKELVRSRTAERGS